MVCQWSAEAGWPGEEHPQQPPPSQRVHRAPFLFFYFIYLFFGGCCTGSACGTIIPQPGIESTPPSLEGRVLTTGPPGRCQQSPFLRERESVSQLVCPTPGIRQAVYGILQARILESVAMLPPGDTPNPGIKCWSPALQADSLQSESKESPSA